MGIRGWESEADSTLFSMIGSRLVGVLKLAALSNGVPVDTVSAHSLRSGGTTAIFHAGYGLLKAKERGRWQSPRFHGYLRYGMQTMRHVGEKMDVAAGLLDFTKSKPDATTSSTFRDEWKKLTSYHHPSSLPAKCTIPARDVSESPMNDIPKSIHLWWLLGNPDKKSMEDLLLFGNSNAFFSTHAKEGYSTGSF